MALLHTLVMSIKVSFFETIGWFIDCRINYYQRADTVNYKDTMYILLLVCNDDVVELNLKQ